MAEKSKSEKSKVTIGNNYGFKFNIRQNIRDLVLPFNFLLKMNIKDSTTLQRTLVFILVVPGVIGLLIYYLTGSWLRIKYMTVDVVIFSIGFTGLMTLYALVNPAIGSNLKSSRVFIVQIYKRVKWKLHFGEREIDTGLSTVMKDGTIIFANGDVGRLFKIDGATSSTAYPSEIAIQESKALNFHKARTKTTTIYTITTSQRQDAERQIKEQEHLQRANENEAIKSIIHQEEYFLKNEVHGKANTLVQHQMYRDRTQNGLVSAIDHLAQMDAEGYMTSVEVMQKRETEEILKDIIQLRSGA
ncbi:hypothetical protein BU107_04660 [Staphylococcus xylosus]|uniref:hypothetical protein n=1 Tax=Staphylococcus xylosus TaxID=1288 RepID=UPI000E68DD08|nr:hypothetical protein [Staphylococcus xylosus]RIM88898.1 hypothetical protein BU107_04660 [Staphylococcus xylosus]